jgi:hypothetical protein
VQIRRRRSTRADAALPVTVRTAAHTCDGTTINVGADGLLARADLDVNTGDSVHISLELTESQPRLEVSGRVVRHDGLIAFRFLRHSHAIRSRLASFVARQRLTALSHRGSVAADL